MLRIHQSPQAGKRPNASTLARELKVSPKSIHHGIELMRDRLELPIEYGRQRFAIRGPSMNPALLASLTG